MSTNTSEARDLLRLYKCVIETGTDVLAAFAEKKLLPAYNGNFKMFLEDKKHDIFHLWQSKKLSCCECPPAGYNFNRLSRMDNWIFKKIYDDNGLVNKAHIVRNGRDVVQVCIHKYITRNIAIHELDISAISFLLRNLTKLTSNENSRLEKITTTRSQICHAYSMNCLSMVILNTSWTDLENALVDLSDHSYKRIIRKHIEYLRKSDLAKDEITQLLDNVEKVIADVNSCLSFDTKAIETTVKENTNTILENMDMLKTNQTANNLEMNERLNKIEQMLHQLNSTSILVKYEKPPDLLKESEKCLVLWQLATPENWNVEEIEQMLTMFEDRFKDLQMKIKFIRRGSLVIMTTVPSKVVNISTDFHSAVKSFLTRMVKVCNIDTNVSCKVDVTLHILNSNELNVTYSLPNKPTDQKSVQTEDRSTDTGNQIIVEPSKTTSLPHFDDGSPVSGDGTTFCCRCLQNNIQVVTQSYCLDCAEPLCEKCCSLHSTFDPLHTIASEVDKDIINQSYLTVPKFCSVHKNQVTNSFCTEHDTLLCDMCEIYGHNSCKSVLSIQKAAENIGEGAIMNDLENRLHNVGIVIESLITTEENNIVHGNAEKEKVHREVNSIRFRINLHLDELEKDFADRLTIAAERSKSSLKYYLPSKLRITKIMKTDIESTKTYDSESEIFKALKILDRNVYRQESAIRTFIKDLQTRRLEFHPPENETLQGILPKLGCLTTSNTPITSLDCRGQLHLKRKREGHIVSFNSDDIGCSVGSGCFINGGKLLFTNFECKHSLHICDRNGMGGTVIKLDGIPLDVATYNSTLVLVTILNRGIQTINVDTNMCERYIYHGHPYAIQCEKKYIWTSTGDSAVYRIDIEGHILQRFEVGFVVRQIALNITGEQVFYSSLTSDRIYTLSKDGKQALFYTCLDKNTFHGLSVDCNGNVLFADTNSNCIRSISQDGKDLETILSVDDGILTPDHLQMNTKTNELMVLSQEKGSIQIFKLI